MLVQLKIHPKNGLPKSWTTICVWQCQSHWTFKKTHGCFLSINFHSHFHLVFLPPAKCSFIEIAFDLDGLRIECSSDIGENSKYVSSECTHLFGNGIKMYRRSPFNLARAHYTTPWKRVRLCPGSPAFVFILAQSRLECMYNTILCWACPTIYFMQLRSRVRFSRRLGQRLSWFWSLVRQFEAVRLHCTTVRKQNAVDISFTCNTSAVLGGIKPGKPLYVNHNQTGCSQRANYVSHAGPYPSSLLTAVSSQLGLILSWGTHLGIRRMLLSPRDIWGIRISHPMRRLLVSTSHTSVGTA